MNIYFVENFSRKYSEKLILLYFVVILVEIFSACSYNKHDNIKKVSKNSTSLGLYVDTTLNNKHINISYMSDTSIVLSLIEQGQKSMFTIRKLDLPKWFDINGFKNKRPELYIRHHNDIDMNTKLFFLGDTILAFPIFDMDQSINLIFIKIENNLKMSYYDPTCPFLLYCNSEGIYHRILVDDLKMRFATKLFYPFMQADYIVMVSSPFVNQKVDTFNISERECSMKESRGYDVNNMKKFLKCVGEMIF